MIIEISTDLDVSTLNDDSQLSIFHVTERPFGIRIDPWSLSKESLETLTKILTSPTFPTSRLDSLRIGTSKGNIDDFMLTIPMCKRLFLDVSFTLDVLRSLIEKNPRLESLGIPSSHIGTSGFCELMKMIPQTLTHLDASGSFGIVDTPLHNVDLYKCSLVSLDLSFNSSIAPRLNDGFNLLEKIVEECSQLSSLTARCCKLDPKDIADVMDAVTINTRLSYLDLRVNFIGDETIPSIATVLEHNSTVNTLLLDSKWSFITTKEPSYELITSSLQYNSSITRLSIYDRSQSHFTFVKDNIERRNASLYDKILSSLELRYGNDMWTENTPTPTPIHTKRAREDNTTYNLKRPK